MHDDVRQYSAELALKSQQKKMKYRSESEAKEFVFSHKGSSIPNVCKGDHVIFARPTFVGSFRNPKYDGHEVIEGLVVSESYGALTAQHTFTVQTADGSKIRIKGRNLYGTACVVLNWEREGRGEALAEKNARGEAKKAQVKAEREMGIL